MIDGGMDVYCRDRNQRDQIFHKRRPPQPEKDRTHGTRLARDTTTTLILYMHKHGSCIHTLSCAAEKRDNIMRR